MIDARQIVGTADILFLTLDTLRLDVAKRAMQIGKIPVLQRLIPGGQWESRHSPGSFTFAAHHAFFAGFLPTPNSPGVHPRLFATKFQGSETTGEQTAEFDAPNIVAGLSQAGYRTICIGGVGFFNKKTPLSRVFPDMFDESYWSPEFGVTDCNSTENQIEQAIRCIESLASDRRYFMFINISAIHQPNCIFAPKHDSDSVETQLAALAYVDRSLEKLFAHISERGKALCIVCSDHGTAYGEDGFVGHRLAHSVVWNVPYAEFVVG